MIGNMLLSEFIGKGIPAVLSFLIMFGVCIFIGKLSNSSFVTLIIMCTAVVPALISITNTDKKLATQISAESVSVVSVSDEKTYTLHNKEQLEFESRCKLSDFKCLTVNNLKDNYYILKGNYKTGDDFRKALKKTIKSCKTISYVTLKYDNPTHTVVKENTLKFIHNKFETIFFITAIDDKPLPEILHLSDKQMEIYDYLISSEPKSTTTTTSITSQPKIKKVKPETNNAQQITDQPFRTEVSDKMLEDK